MGIINTILKFIVNNQKLILVGLLILASVTAFMYRDAFQQQKAETQKQIDNIEALSDSVRTVQNKAGELQREKLTLQSDKKQLRTLNEDLAKEVDKQEGKVNQLTQLVADLRADTGRVDTTYRSEVGLGTYKFTWSKEESGDKWNKVLEGYFVVEADTLVKPTLIENRITKDNLNMEIVTGIKEVDGKKTIFVRSSYPGLTFTDINGAIIEERAEFNPKPKRWSLGPAVGYGLDMDGNSAPFVGFTLQYSFIRF